MGIEELQIIAEIIGGLESTGITGLMAFLGFSLLKVLLLVGVILTIVWCAYKLINRAIDSTKDQERLHAIAGLLGQKTYGTFMDDEYIRTCSAIEYNLEYKARWEENKERVKDYQARLGQLTSDYEALWQEHELAKATMDRQTSMIRQLDESINSKYDRKQEDTSERTEDISNTGALSGRDNNVPE